MMTSGTQIHDADEPPPGQILHYIVRATMPNAGGWGGGEDGQRTDVCE